MLNGKIATSQQNKLRNFMQQQGSEFGAELASAVIKQLGGLLRRATVRDGAVAIIFGQVAKQTERLRKIGHDDLAVTIFIDACDGEFIARMRRYES